MSAFSIYFLVAIPFLSICKQEIILILFSEKALDLVQVQIEECIIEKRVKDQKHF